MTASASAVLQISDPHFGTERPPVAEALLAMAQRLAPELVLLTGDITQRATRSQFAAARAFADRLAPAPVLAIAGNHDIPLFNLFARVCWPYARMQQVFGDELEPCHRSTHWLVVGVKTTRRWRHKHGEVSSAQIARVAAQLRQATPGQLRVVAVHQPVAVSRERDRHDLLRGHAEAVRSWADAGADLIVGGHIHLPYVLPLQGLYGSLTRPAWCVQAGTAMSSRVRPEADNSVNVLRHGAAGDGVRRGLIERWDYMAARQCFEQVACHELTLGAALAHG